MPQSGQPTTLRASPATIVTSAVVGSTQLIVSAAGMIDGKDDGTRQTIMDVKPPSVRSIAQVQRQTARKLRESPVLSATQHQAVKERALRQVSSFVPVIPPS
jgi:hypothetical protein